MDSFAALDNSDVEIVAFTQLKSVPDSLIALIKFDAVRGVFNASASFVAPQVLQNHYV
ncbi:TPA: hypothetical protein L7639_004564 [Klebsiella pneumoniae subsp. pneumoniae]|nr:hypothetical protein [Klebsiella pneumoniae subsp. pneumoniae]